MTQRQLRQTGMPWPASVLHLEALDVRYELVLLLRYPFVVHAVEVPLLPELVPGAARTCCHLTSCHELLPHAGQLIFQFLQSSMPARFPTRLMLLCDKPFYGTT